MDDEVGVQLADLGTVDGEALAAGSFDQTTGVVALGVAEDGAGVALGGGLAGLAGLKQPRHLSLALDAGARFEGERCFEDDVAAASEVGAAVVEVQVAAGESDDLGSSEELDGIDERSDLAAVADACIALERAADGAGDTDGELEAAEVVGDRGAGERGEHDASAGSDLVAFEGGVAASAAE